MEEVVIRPYVPSDRQVVRQLCCETADRGEPVERFFRDREVFADLLTRYYTDYEPQSLWVADRGGTMIGYVTGCVDSRRCDRVSSRRIIPEALFRAVGRGALGSPQAWRLVQAGLRTYLQDGAHRRVRLDGYPAHLHVNVRGACRGQRVGRRLVERFLRQASEADLAGIHAAVRSDNPSACRFFERLGFTELGRQRVTFPTGEALSVHDTILYGRRLQHSS